MGRKELRSSGFNDSFFRWAVTQACLRESGNSRIVVTRCRWWWWWVWVLQRTSPTTLVLDRGESAWRSLVAMMFVLLLLMCVYF